MGPIYKQLFLQGNIADRQVTALFDTGASRCFIERDIAYNISTLTKAPHALTFEMALGTLETDEVILASVLIDGYRLYGTFIVVPNLSEELILGADFLQQSKIKLDPDQEEVTVDPAALRLKLL